jgi:hypothetical protein
MAFWLYIKGKDIYLHSNKPSPGQERHWRGIIGSNLLIARSLDDRKSDVLLHVLKSSDSKCC